jgi:copper transport protein
VTGVRGIGALGVVAAAALVFPAIASAHAALLRTTPEASVVVNTPPKELTLTYSEPVEPRFATVSVTDPDANQKSDGRPRRSPTNPDTLVVPLRHLGEGWYLVYWRVISADGHPVRGAYTFAVGPNQGPAPEFVIPSISESAATPGLLIARWATFLLAMAAIGLFVLRMLIARVVQSRLPSVSLRPLSVAFGVALGLALVATPVYVVMSTAKFAQRSVFDLGNVVPLLTSSSFGRGFLDLELVLALFAIAGCLAIWLDEPKRDERSIAALLAAIGAFAAAGAAMLIPGLAGHAAQTSPRWLSLVLDWAHLAAGATWIGGLVGLLILGATAGEERIAALAIGVPRFSKIALASVLVLIGTGIGSSLTHFPTFDSLLDTSYGKALVLKLILLGGTIVLASVNFTRTAPRFARIAAGAIGHGASPARLLRTLVAGEVTLVAGAFFGAALLTSLAPPPKALASLGSITAKVGPGPASTVVEKNGYRMEFAFSPNRAAVPNTFSVKISKGGKPVTGADVTATFTMLDMEMQQLAYSLPESSPGVFMRPNTPALVMVGRWGIAFDIRPPGGSPIDVLVEDHASG